jgi:hypothetical protein
MVLGCIICPAKYVDHVNSQIMKIKEDFGISRFAEIKWTKVSNSKLDLFKRLIDLFFELDYLNFRAVIVTHKKQLNHQAFLQDHDTWYYKMYYLLLRNIIEIGEEYKIFLDIKDTRSSNKIEALKYILNRSLYDFFNETIRIVQTVRSEEVQILQLTDLLIGAVSYVNRDLNTSKAKLEIVNYIQSKSGINLKSTTPKSYHKFNIFVWTPRRY